MAMNKTERAALEYAQNELSIARALRWSRHEPVPKDLPPPTTSFGPDRRYTEGWSTNMHSRSVMQQWSEFVSHGMGPYHEGDRFRSGARGSISLYSSRLLALQALRYEIERDAAKTLAKIDAQIEAEISSS